LKKIAVIGAGASGLMAACYAAGEDREVVIFEKEKKIGRKLLITGNGRCNITNRNISTDHYHGQNPRVVHNLFARFGLDETIDFFHGIGIPFAEGKDGKLFPASLQASTVPKIFQYELKKRNVDIMLHRRIDSIEKKGEQFHLTTAGQEEFFFDTVILAAGSCAYSSTGASRRGYELARSLGHTIRKPWPVILPLNIPLKKLHRLQGIKWDVSMRVESKGRIITESTGEILFTGYGISGPVTLDVSRWVNESIMDGGDPTVIIDLFPGMDSSELSSELDLLWEDGGKKTGFSLQGILKERMPEVFLEMWGIDPEKRVLSLSKAERKRIAEQLKNLQLKPGEPRSFDEAVAAAGGVRVGEVNPRTMESTLVKGLYITGELLDIDGDSGGFNLQFAWSTGAIAGMEQ